MNSGWDINRNGGVNVSGTGVLISRLNPAEVIKAE